MRLAAFFRNRFSAKYAFRSFGEIGFVVAVPFALVLAAKAGLSAVLMAFISIACSATLLVAAIASTILTGEETLVFYRDIVLILAVAATIVRLLHRSVLPYLDVTILGAGTFLVLGRCGCLRVGCCHGRPSRWGIRYGRSHAECGFPDHYVGVPLFPIQAVESIFVFCVVGIGTAILWRGAPPGTIFSFHIVAYGSGRFLIDFARGDAERPFLWNFSEAQWTSLLLVWAVVLAGRSHILPLARWHLAAAIGMVLCLAAVAVKRHMDSSRRFELLHPHHVSELAQATKRILEFTGNHTSPSVSVFTTSLGVRVSGGTFTQDSPCIRHYCFSSAGAPLTRDQAEILAHISGFLCKTAEPFRLIPAQPSLFHVLFACRPRSH